MAPTRSRSEIHKRNPLTPVYQVRKRFSDGRGAARVDKDGDISVSFPRSAGQTSTSSALFGSGSAQDEEEDEFADPIDGDAAHEDRHEAWRFLLAGGIAGAGALRLEGRRSPAC